ncbi:hypothetical protein SAMN02745133_01946 [Desulforamulus putei DSM 12395]|uniref:Uncharacterized protein n=1 Tax=Desulforamulus putei DSM 12395 TaxID=1121429 RepID=A0A1M4ZBU0_9FIRM|nr:hypothetical protein [Desulforamulus putei]SHF15500.1 hypothetical protein SAMN02745133_01946 [Desulforamulus putei DSM 12395]
MYKYEEFKDEKAILTIFHDEDAENPREWDNLGTMVCWHRRYNLGDQHRFADKDEFLFWLLEETVGDTEKAEKIYEKIRNSIDREVYRSYGAYNKAIDDEILAVIEQKFIILPLYLYDHSGITMNTTGFSCPWDSGQVGWIYCSKERFRKETGYTESELFSHDKHRAPVVGELVKLKGYADKGFGKIISIENSTLTVDFDYNKVANFRKDENIVCVPLSDVEEVMANRAVQLLQSEVETYSQWLEGDVYGFVLKDAEGNEIDSCWGFYGTDWEKNGLSEHIPSEYRYLLEKAA